MDHPLHSNGQVSTTHREPRRPYSPSQTELSSPETCCDSYSGGTMSFQRLRYTSPWGIETTPSSYAISPSQTPTELMMEDPFASFCNNQPDMPPSLMTPCSSSKELSEWSVGSHPQQSETPATVFYTASLGPPSPAFSSSSSSCQSPQFGNTGSSVSNPTPTPEADDRRAGLGSEEDSNADPPYSLLIYQALRSAPGMKLPLQGIYSWFEKNTAKGKDQNSKGWQNSIRHNLSMNAGFEAVKQESVTGKKAINFWRLTEEAIKNGIQSTTRFRKQANYKRSLSSDPPAPQRQRSGAKGGKTARATKNRHDEPRKERYRQRSASRRRQQQQQQQQQQQRHHQQQEQRQEQHKVIYPQSPAIVSQFHIPTPATPPITSSPVETFDLGSIVGCAELPACMPIFSDFSPWSETECLTSYDNGILGWCGIHSIPNTNGFLTCPDIATDIQLGV